MPLVSIIIPCFNAGKWLAQAVDSALAQTWPDKEIVVVNDGSTDRSLAIAREYERRGVRVLDQQNRGASAARNAGLGVARGAFIQYLDADDLLADDKIARQLATLLAADPARTLSSSAWARFSGRPEDAHFEPHANWRDLTGVEFLQLHYEHHVMMQPAAWLAPRALLDRAGPWNETLSLNDDGEYFARVMLAADLIVFCREARSYYRSEQSASLSRRADSRALESLFHSVDWTTRHLLAADSSTRSRAAAAYAWKWTAFELYPNAPDLSRAALRRSQALGGSRRPFPAGRKFQLVARVLGWRLAKRLMLAQS